MSHVKMSSSLLCYQAGIKVHVPMLNLRISHVSVLVLGVYTHTIHGILIIFIISGNIRTIYTQNQLSLLLWGGIVPVSVFPFITYKLDTMLAIFSWTLLCFKLIQSLNTW